MVHHYLGEPQALDGQLLRWCTQTELESTEMLPADRPIVAALRLPERLEEAETPDYRVTDSPYRSHDGRLCGVLREQGRSFGRRRGPVYARASRSRRRGRLEPAESAPLPIERDFLESVARRG